MEINIDAAINITINLPPGYPLPVGGEDFLGDIKAGIVTMSTELDELRAAVAADTDATNSAVTLINSMAERIRALADDPAAIRALADQFEANTKALADAVAANTPAAPDAGGAPSGGDTGGDTSGSGGDDAGAGSGDTGGGGDTGAGDAGDPVV